MVSLGGYELTWAKLGQFGTLVHKMSFTNQIACKCAPGLILNEGQQQSLEQVRGKHNCLSLVFPDALVALHTI